MYMTEAELAAEGLTDVTSLRARTAEATIEGYCGQRFDQWSETVAVVVDEDGVAALPYRVLNVDFVAEEDGSQVDPENYRVTSSAVRGQVDALVMRRETVETSGFDMFTKGLEPWATRRPVYTRTRRLTATGTFGWATVPDDVKTALVALLTKPVRPGDAETNVKKWSMKGMSVEYGDQALDESTGDLKLDRLLAPYRVRRSTPGTQVH